MFCVLCSDMVERHSGCGRIWTFVHRNGRWLVPFRAEESQLRRWWNVHRQSQQLPRQPKSLLHRARKFISSRSHNSYLSLSVSVSTVRLFVIFFYIFRYILSFSFDSNDYSCCVYLSLHISYIYRSRRRATATLPSGISRTLKLSCTIWLIAESDASTKVLDLLSLW